MAAFRFDFVFQFKEIQTLYKRVHYNDLGWCVDPNGRVEQDVVTQLFEQHDTVL